MREGLPGYSSQARRTWQGHAEKRHNVMDWEEAGRQVGLEEGQGGKRSTPRLGALRAFNHIKVKTKRTGKVHWQWPYSMPKHSLQW